MPRPKFSAVLFDCDGVLVDSEAITNAVLREMLIELGWDISQEECISIFIGKALKDQWEPILAHTGVRIDKQWITGFRQRRDVALRENLQAVPGALEAVKQISAAYCEKIACATGADRAKVEMQLSITRMAPFSATGSIAAWSMPRASLRPMSIWRLLLACILIRAKQQLSKIQSPE